MAYQNNSPRGSHAISPHRDTFVLRFRFVGFALIALAAIAAVFAFRACNAAVEPQEDAQAEVVSYDWSCLHVEGDRYSYVVDGQVKSKLGIDVSEFQGSIDWDAVAQDGISFAYVRVGNRGAETGTLYSDDLFEDNLSGAQTAGLPCGVYFFSQAINEDEAREEAQFVLDALGGRSLEYPIAYDCEEVSGLDSLIEGLSADQMTANAKAFCEVIEAADYKAIIYGNANDFARYNVQDLSAYPFWYASYNELPYGATTFMLWQYTDGATVSGVPTACDMSIQIELS